MTLSRKTPMRRTRLTTSTSRLARRPKVRKPAKRTGPTTATRLVVATRSGGRCERCGTNLATSSVGVSVHHRRPRGMGGTTDPAINSPANLLHLCGTGTTGCHGQVEADRRQSTTDGYLVPLGVDPATWPVLVWMPSGTPVRVYLDHNGDYLFQETA